MRNLVARCPKLDVATDLELPRELGTEREPHLVELYRRLKTVDGS